VDLQFEVRGAIRLFPFETAGVERMVTCLLDNALKFTPRGKPVLLTVEPYFWERRSARQMPVLERRKNGRSDANAALVSVLDAGPGILPEDQQEIFEEFYSAAAGGVKPGTGLGLAIARYVAQMHGGKIWVESSVGKGSRFCVVLPF
jgi:two-component system sensor histidine kinase MprB